MMVFIHVFFFTVYTLRVFLLKVNARFLLQLEELNSLQYCIGPGTD